MVYGNAHVQRSSRLYVTKKGGLHPGIAMATVKDGNDWGDFYAAIDRINGRIAEYAPFTTFEEFGFDITDISTWSR
jgi:hypothetical protein